uniref:Uncharacterized protein n=1 Tax=Acrobeloides nanus TaxID=290746 RepID=A0A914CXE5_9BILA
METTNFCIFVLLFEFLFYQLGESKTHSMPCCLESIGNSACMEMKRRRPMEFEERCKTDADFGMLQCCATCETEVAKLGKDLFADGKRSRHCFDRHNKKFCLQFLYQVRNFIHLFSWTYLFAHMIQNGILFNH